MTASNTAPRLLSAAEAARAINPALDAKTFKRLADRHGVPHYKLGRDRFYAVDDITTLLERTLRCPDEDEGRGWTGAAERGSSAGRKTDAHASAAQARLIVEKLKKPLSGSSPSAANDRRESARPTRT
ncbi:MAG: helix-turn-helix domain-containing protein [Caenispirillum bisanense]|nr:helix-turn-helix domain-containing protein [Caenispirillum bisanense]MCA1971261.1 helix-turn-helix domain-containing protein [Caenispirillum sp.]